MTDRTEPTDARTRLVRRCSRAGVDLTAVAVLTAVTNLFVLVPVLRETPGRLVAGFAFLLFAPGYALVAALFPRRSGSDADADGVAVFERVALAVVASVLAVPLVGIGLSVAGVGVTPLPLVGCLSALTLGGTGYAALRRVRTRADARSDVSLSAAVPQAPVERGTALDAALAVVTVVALVGVGFAVVAPSGGSGYTELYLLTETESGELVAADYPRSVTVGENRSLTLGVRNHEGETADYTAVVALQRVETANGTADSDVTAASPPADGRVVAQTELRRYTPTLAPNESWHRQHTVSPPFAGERVRLVYLLYRGEAPSDPTVRNADREVHLWLDVSPANGSR